MSTNHTSLQTSAKILNIISIRFNILFYCVQIFCFVFGFILFVVGQKMSTVIGRLVYTNPVLYYQIRVMLSLDLRCQKCVADVAICFPQQTSQ